MQLERPAWGVRKPGERLPQKLHTRCRGDTSAVCKALHDPPTGLRRTFEHAESTAIERYVRQNQMGRGESANPVHIPGSNQPYGPWVKRRATRRRRLDTTPSLDPEDLSEVVAVQSN